MTLHIPELKILVVEDEDSKIGEWSDAVDAHNADHERKGFSLRIEFAKNVIDAKSELERHRFDAAVVDLRLQIEAGVAENNSQGNDLVRHIIGAHPLGVVVYTGQRADADVDSYKCPQVRVMDKADGMEQVFSWLSENKEVFLRLRGATSAFNRETARVFFSSIWPRWSHWTQPVEGASDLTDVVARHVVAHVHDALLIADGEAIHPEEAYFVPPMRGRLDTGDLIEQDGSTWIVVTPRCDLANNGKVATILLAYCEEISERWKQLKEGGAKSDKELRKLIQHGGMPKQHFLYPMRDVEGNHKGPWLVHFHHLQALPSGKALEALPTARFASLSPLFVPSLVERFGAYFSRIGTPDLSSD